MAFPPPSIAIASGSCFISIVLRVLSRWLFPSFLLSEINDGGIGDDIHAHVATVSVIRSVR